jgi:hypothetical protein
MLLASNQTCVGAKSYAYCLYLAFLLLSRRKCAALLDPQGIAGRIACAGTTAKKETALAAINHAVDHASTALAAEHKGYVTEAYRQWDIVFNGYFPK